MQILGIERCSKVDTRCSIRIGNRSRIALAVAAQRYPAGVEVELATDGIAAASLEVVVQVLCQSLFGNRVGSKPFVQVRTIGNGLERRCERRELLGGFGSGISIALLGITDGQDGQFVVDILLALSRDRATVNDTVVDDWLAGVAEINQVDAVTACSHYNRPRDGLRLAVGTGCNRDFVSRYG